MKDGQPEGTPPTVSRGGGAKQGGEVRARWAWAEPAVWTERMLAALERGVKGGVWFSLMDKVWSRENLRAAWRKVKANGGAAGVDRVTVERFAAREEEEIARLHDQMKSGAYAPQPVRRVWIPKGDGTKRPLGIPTVRDRVAQTALRNALEPIFEREFAEGSYGFRPGRGAHDAIRRVDELLAGGRRCVVDADIKGCFDSIPKGPLMARIRERVADGRVLAMAERFLGQPVMEGLEAWTPERGTPQGAVISPLLANLYLHPFDLRMAEAGYETIRYADDFVVLCRTRDEAEAALKAIRGWMEEAGLTLHPDKTRIVAVDEGETFDFLGYRFMTHRGRDLKFPRPKSEKKLRDAIRPKTRRTSGDSLASVIRQVNPVLRGWYAYFRHSHKTAFPKTDKWVRGRLRSILRKRKGGKGRGRGLDHIEWPNVYFSSRGLFSLTTAHALTAEPSRR